MARFKLDILCLCLVFCWFITAVDSVETIDTSYVCPHENEDSRTNNGFLVTGIIHDILITNNSLELFIDPQNTAGNLRKGNVSRNLVKFGVDRRYQLNCGDLLQVGKNMNFMLSSNGILISTMESVSEDSTHLLSQGKSIDLGIVHRVFSLFFFSFGVLVISYFCYIAGSIKCRR